MLFRSGAAAGSGLAFPRSLPLVSLCSLESFISPEEGPFASMIDARIGGAYVLLQERIKDNIFLRADAQFVSKDNLANYTANYPIKAGPHIGYPDPQYLAEITAQKLEKGEYGPDLKLLYLRTPEYLSS